MGKSQDGRAKRFVRAMYESHDSSAVHFRYALIAFDFLSIAFFIATTPMPMTPTLKTLSLVIGLVIALDLFCRLWIAEDRWALLRRVYVIADIVVRASLVIEPVVALDLTFLRMLRGLRVVHSYHLLRDLRYHSDFFRRNEDAVLAATNLLVFIFFTTALVFAFTFDHGDGLESYVDALYFTVTTLTTTGYGDITPTTMWAKLGAIAMMAIGGTLFVKLARAIFTPSKVHYPCPNCGLQRHDPDAVHCKHCGVTLAIKTDGA